LGVSFDINHLQHSTLEVKNEMNWQTHSSSQASDQSRLFGRLGLLVNVFERAFNAIIFRRPVGEINDAASLGAKRAVGIIFPLSRLSAYRALHPLNTSSFRFDNDTTKPGEHRANMMELAAFHQMVFRRF